MVRKRIAEPSHVVVAGAYNISGNTTVSYGGGWDTNLVFNGAVANLGAAYSQSNDFLDTVSFTGISSGEATAFASIGVDAAFSTSVAVTGTSGALTHQVSLTLTVRR